MLFNSFAFLLCFLTISIVAYYLIPFRIGKNAVLLAVSIIFYCWTDYKLILIILIEALFAFLMAVIIYNTEKTIKTIAYIFSLVTVIGALIYYKYAGFFLQIINSGLSVNIAGLPLGISFYTFNIISYLTDVYKNETKADMNPFNVILYLLFFPFVLSGPLQRYKFMREQFVNRKYNLLDIANGLRRFIIGLGKKVLIANNLAIISDYVFRDLPMDEYSAAICWLGAISYSLQLFFDFAGYSDMAIGLANIFGFKSAENFNYPYIASSITDFWRRWHISLSTWFRDYIYIPMGGNRVGKLRWLFNLFVVWALTGLWHGAAYNYIIWGLYYCLILIVEKLFLLKILKKAYVIRNIYSIVLIVVGWVIFNCTSAEQVFVFIKTMFSGLPIITIEFLDGLSFLYLLPYLLAAVVLSTPLFKFVYDKLNNNVITGIVVDAVLVLILITCVIFLINSSYTPFLYFQY